MKRELIQLEELKKLSSSMRLAAESWKKPWQTLISTILSTRTRDETTIPTANELFKKYPTVTDLTGARLKDVQKIIRPINFYKTKSKNIINCAKLLVEKYNSRPPHDLDKLLELPGVGRKTANVFLTEMGKNALGVDTHVYQIARKLGWSNSNRPEGVEKDLKRLFPKTYWSKVNGILVRFGKSYTSRRRKDEILEKIKRI